jgi:hypothetical protein
MVSRLQLCIDFWTTLLLLWDIIAASISAITSTCVDAVEISGSQNRIRRIAYLLAMSCVLRLAKHAAKVQSAKVSH